MAATVIENRPTVGRLFKKTEANPFLRPYVIKSISSEAASDCILRVDSIYLEHTHTRQSRRQTYLQHDDHSEFDGSLLSNPEPYTNEELLSTVSDASTSIYNCIDAKAHLPIVEALVRRFLGLTPISRDIIGFQNIRLCSSSPHPSWLVALGLLSNTETRRHLVDSGHIPSENDRENLRDLPAHSYSCHSGTSLATAAIVAHTSTGSKTSIGKSGTHARGKRKRTRKELSEPGSDDEEADPPEEFSKKHVRENSGSDRKFACLFYKRYPRKHFGCGKCSFVKISHVIQHLERTHFKATFNCALCGDCFARSTIRDEHIREQKCQKRDFELDTIPADFWDEIHAVSKRNSKTGVEKWNDVFKILFRGSPLPLPWHTDPYEEIVRMFERLISDDANVSRVVNAVQLFNTGSCLYTGNGSTSQVSDSVRTVYREIINDHVASGREPSTSSQPTPSLWDPTSSRPEIPAPISIWDTFDNSLDTTSQLQPFAILESPMSDMNHLNQPQEIPSVSHGLGHDTIRANQEPYNGMDTRDSPSDFFSPDDLFFTS